MAEGGHDKWGWWNRCMNKKSDGTLCCGMYYVNTHEVDTDKKVRWTDTNRTKVHECEATNA